MTCLSDSEGADRLDLLQPKDTQPAITKSRSENNAHNDQESDSEIINVIAKRKRNKRVRVIVSSDSSGSDDDEIVEQIKRKRVAGIGDETPELFALTRVRCAKSLLRNNYASNRLYKRLIGCY